MANILVVDDSALMRRNLTKILTSAGHTIAAEAENGLVAVKQYEKLKPDLVTMDITMPIMDGIETVKKIREIDSNAKIIMISALDQSNMVYKAMENGAKNYILKPINPAKVIEIIKKVLSIPDKSVETLADSEDDIIIISEKKHESEISLNIENKNGVFFIKIESAIDLNYVMALDASIKNLFFIKPLNLVFEFEKLLINDDIILTELLAIIEKIKKAGGSIALISKNDQMLEIFGQYEFDKLCQINNGGI